MLLIISIISYFDVGRQVGRAHDNQEGHLHQEQEVGHPSLLRIQSQSTAINTQILGRGAYGVVYKARLKEPPHTYRVVKLIAKKMVKNPESLQN